MLAPQDAKPTRGGAEKSEPPHRGGTPWRAESPGELRAVHGSKPPELGGGLSRGANPCRRGSRGFVPGAGCGRVASAAPHMLNGRAERASARGLRWPVRSARSGVREGRWAAEPTTGGDEAPETAYGCARGTKLWRAQPHERNRHETGPAGTWRIKASRGRENLRTQVVRARQANTVMLLSCAGRR